MKYIPNIISIIRIVLSLLMIIVVPFTSLFYAIYLICGASDVLDGYIARKFNYMSSTGAKIDSFADLIMFLVVFNIVYDRIFWSREVYSSVFIIFVLRLFSVIINYIKFNRLVVYHTISSKIVGFSLFLIIFFIPSNISLIYIYIVIFLAIYAAIEELLISIFIDHFDANIKSFLKCIRKRNRISNE